MLAYAESIAFNYYFRLAHVLHVERFCIRIRCIIPNELRIIFINPRRACAERVTVVVSCVCVCVCLYVCPNTLFWQYAQLEV